jgi:hypothetical protein
MENCLQIRTEAGERVVRLKVEVRQSSKERKWHPHAFVPVPAQVDGDTAQQLVHLVSTEVENSDHRQARCVALFQGTKVPVSTRPWETPYSDDDDDDGGGLNGQDPATAIVAQCMRHNEVLLMRMQLMADAQIKNLTRQNELLAGQQEAILKDRLELANAYRTVLLEQGELEAKTARDVSLAESAKVLVQAFAYKLSGGTVAQDERLNTLERMLRTFGDTLTEEQAESLAGMLTPSQLIALQAMTTDPLAKVDQLVALKKDKAKPASE